MRAKTKGNVYVFLSEDRLRTILKKHPELQESENLIIETVENPDYILQGWHKELIAIRFYTETPVGPKHLVVVYREDKGIIITSFFTSKVSKLLRRRKLLWKRR